MTSEKITPKKRRTSDAVYHANESKRLREIGPLPKVKDPARRAQAETDIVFWAETYFSEWLNRPFSPDHIEILTVAASVILENGQYAYCMPRGFGKSTLMAIVILWAVLFGKAKYVVLITGEITLACDMLQIMFEEFCDNESLLEDFPELECFRALDYEPRKQGGQTVDGLKTKLKIASDSLRMPTLKGYASSGAVIQVKSITSRFRGLVKRIEGKRRRPGLVVLDDIQSDQSAASPEQVAKYLNTINKGVLGLAEPGKGIAVFSIATVIFRGDVCDTLLNHELSPDWRGKKCKRMYSMPENIELWENEYRELRNRSLDELGNISLATNFYREHREAMSKGAVPAWKECFERNELDAVQSAMELYLKDKTAFYSEQQNEPLEEERTVGQIRLETSALNGLDRYTVPEWATHLTLGIDVGRYLAAYVVLACTRDMTAAVVDYGTFPQQSSHDFIFSTCRHTFYDGGNYKENIFNSLVTCFRTLLQPWKRADGCRVQISGGLCDVGYEPAAVEKAIEASGLSGYIIPAKGFGTSITNRQIFEWVPKTDTERIQDNMRITSGDKGVERILLDANAWKSQVAMGCNITQEKPGHLEIFGKDFQRHAMFLRHLTSEYPVYATARGITMAEWKNVTKENHFLDALVYAYGAAALEDCRFLEPLTFGPPAPRPHTEITT